MTTDTLLRECRGFMARYSSVEPQTVEPLLKRIDAHLAAPEERERGRVIEECAKVCDSYALEQSQRHWGEISAGLREAAALIRALSHPAPDSTLAKPSPATTVSVPREPTVIKDFPGQAVECARLAGDYRQVPGLVNAPCPLCQSSKVMDTDMGPTCSSCGCSAPSSVWNCERQEIDSKYHELLYAVGNKYPGETRHQTALRYIQNAERISGETTMQSAKRRGEES